MSDDDTESSLFAFRAPNDHNWHECSGDETEEAIKNNAKVKKDLKNVLLGSLQMQNLVVLAGSGSSLSAGGPKMQDLWDAAVGEDPLETAQEVAKRVKHDFNCQNIELFLSRIEAFLQVNQDRTVSDFLKQSKQIILEKCSSFLSFEKLEAHKTFLHRLSRRRIRDKRLCIFTTNYDLCFESAAAELNSVALDGFSFGSFNRRFDPSFYDYDIIRRPRTYEEQGYYLEGVFLLYKLHGSTNWERTDDGRVIEKAHPDPDRACLIYPATGKYQQSFTQPYLESMARFLSAVREPNTCILVAGFGFNDNHLSEPLLAAASSNPHLRIIIIDPEAKNKIDGANLYWKRLAQHSLEGEDIWFLSATFEDFAHAIPDLKSLTPADELLKAINRATREA